jgi:hypothetical protein
MRLLPGIIGLQVQDYDLFLERNLNRFLYRSMYLMVMMVAGGMYRIHDRNTDLK